MTNASQSIPFWRQRRNIVHNSTTTKQLVSRDDYDILLSSTNDKDALVLVRTKMQTSNMLSFETPFDNLLMINDSLSCSIGLMAELDGQKRYIDIVLLTRIGSRSNSRVTVTLSMENVHYLSSQGSISSFPSTNALHVALMRYNADYYGLLLQEFDFSTNETVQTMHCIVSMLTVCDDRVFVNAINRQDTIPFELFE